MYLALQHTLRFRYSQPVFLEPMQLRLRPRSDGSQQVESFRLEVSPGPAGWSESVDLHGNAVSQIWFDELHDGLTLAASCYVRTRRENPFDFLLEHDAQQLPMTLDFEHARVLAAFLDAGDIRPEVAEFAETIARENDRRPLDTALGLARSISERFDWTTRPSGPPWRPEETLDRGEGSCRDLTVLYLACARKLGLPSRFVSGYQHQRPDDAKARPSEDASHSLHAWAEVFLPGAGWRGIDPSAGILTADHHIAVSAAPGPVGTMPTEGSFRGTEATSDLETSIRIEPVDEPDEEATPGEVLAEAV